MSHDPARRTRDPARRRRRLPALLVAAGLRAGRGAAGAGRAFRLGAGGRDADPPAPRRRAGRRARGPRRRRRRRLRRDVRQSRAGRLRTRAAHAALGLAARVRALAGRPPDRVHGLLALAGAATLGILAGMDAVQGSADAAARARLEDQIAWYDSRSQLNQRWYKRVKIIQIVVAAAIPAAAAASAPGWLLGVGGAIIVVLEGL